MNFDCRLPDPRTIRSRLQAIADGWNDPEYWTPCDVASLLARELVARIEAPWGGFYYEVTEKGKSLLTQGGAEL